MGTETPDLRVRTEGWSRGRGLAAAIVAIAVVAVALVFSRLDLANELTVVRSQLRAANDELAENQIEIDELEDVNRGQEEDVAACTDLAQLSRRLQEAVALLQRALERGDQARLARGISLFSDAREDWLRATRACVAATEGENQS